ncbi:MAG: hypothetical protein PHV33_13810 [Elusimicrobiales bacterium]|nr:hypothetical protein [Elusimicrobiales bacterium]
MWSLLKENKLKAAVFAGGLALFAAALLPGAALEDAFSRYTFYCLLALYLALAAAVISFAAKRREQLPGFFARNKAGFLFSLALAAVIFVAAKPSFRILSDETNLLSVSRTMLSERRVDNITQGKWYYFNLQPLARERDKRPYAYPFAVYAAHALTGYRPANAFAVNFVLLALLFCGIFAFFRGLYGAAPAYAAVLLAAAQPLLILNATSGGMDFMYAALIFFSFLALREYLKDGCPENFGLLLALLLLLANTRYEGPVFLAAAAVILLLAGRVKAAGLATWQFAVLPLTLLPVFVQRVCFSTNFEQAAGVVPFSAASLLKNTVSFLLLQFNGSLLFPYASLVNLAGLAAAGALFLRLARRGGGEGEDRLLAGIAAAGLALYWLVTCLYYFGDPAHQASARLFLPAVLTLSLLAAGLLARVTRGRPVPALLASAALFLFYAPSAAENRFYNSLFLGREYRHQVRFLEGLGDDHVLVIADRPGQFVVLDRGAINFDYARANYISLAAEQRRHLFSRVIVFQEILYATGRPTPATELGPEYKLRPLLERQNTADSFLRFSEAVFPPAP